MLRIAATLLLFVSSLFIGNSAFAANDPSLYQINTAIQAGRLDEAQRMMGIVLHDHPSSAKAHYVEARVLTLQGRFDDAAAELNNAERLKPGLPFVKSEAVQALKQQIAARSTTAIPVKRRSFPWGMLLLGLASIVALPFLIRAMSRRNAYYPARSQFGPQAGPQPMYGSQPYGPMSGGGMGSSIMGGLATGAAVGAGMVAGEELAHHFMDGDSGAANAATPMGDASGVPADFSGNDFGIIDDGTSWDDGSSFGDFGGGDFGGSDWS